MANLKLEKYEEVIKDSIDALRLDPNFLKAHHRRGKAYMALKRYDLAIYDLEKILEKEPQSKDII
jgi:tetratricopeptide (TPR) repeat protein